jgi:TatD DNase family protein
LIDFHCHLDLFDNPEQLAERCEEAHVYVLSVTTTPKAWRKTVMLGRNRRFIRTALGLHPELAHERFRELPLFEALLGETRYVGEIGLDGSPAYREHADIQRKVFERALAASREHGGRIFSVHSRGAAEVVIAALRQHGCAETAVLHWFSGTPKELRAAIAVGCWFSVGPAMLRSENGRNLVARMPRDRVLTETDGPFAKRGRHPLMPFDVSRAIAELARLWSVAEHDVDGQLNSNLKELVSRVPDPHPHTMANDPLS